MSFTLTIIIVTCLISYAAFQNPSLKSKLMHRPYAAEHDKEWYRFVTSGFIHRDWIHLGINMFVLYGFGEYVEARFAVQFGLLTGKLLFLLMYILAIIFAGLPSYYRHRNNPGYAALGASGAVSGVLLGYVVFQPWTPIYLYAILPIPAIIAAVLYLGYSYYADRKGGGNIGHDAHFYGAVFGFLFTIMIHPAWAGEFWTNLISVF